MPDPLGDVNLAVAFLDRWEPDGPWLITAIKPDSRAIETRRFDDPEPMRAWLDHHQGQRNLYFSVNRPRAGLNGRAKKQDIEYALALHVDLDPPKDTPNADLATVQAKLHLKLERAQPPPSCIVFSGGGYQGFWLLDEPVEITDAKDVEWFEAYNLGLAQQLGADHCHNIDRIMRVPGTLNLPDARKRALGRSVAVAALIHFDLDQRYRLDDFTPVNSKKPGNGVDTSRSGIAFRKGVALRRQGASFDEMCAALRADAECGAWVLEKGDAHDGRELRRIWDRAVGVAVGGVAADDFRSYMPTHKYIFMPSRDLWPSSSVNARVPPIVIAHDEDGKPVTIPASVWLDQNRPVEQMTWAPGLPEIIKDRLIIEGGWIKRKDVSCFNLYMPPTLAHGDPSKAAPWLSHVRLIYPDDAERILSWLAHRVQRPQEKINHALILSGAPGIGKDTLLEPVKRAIGPWNFREASPIQVLGRFNGFLKGVILRISEIKDLGETDRYAFYEHMKAITAAPPHVLRCDEKNIREHAILNVCGVIYTTNYKAEGLYLPADDRRHDVAWSRFTKEDFSEAYWTGLWSFFDNGGDAHVAAYLAERDLSTFNPKAPPPKTDAFWDIVNAHRPGETAELADALDSLGNPDAVTLREIITHHGINTDFAGWLKDRRNRTKIPHRLEDCGYVPVRNPDADDGLWRIQKKREVVYSKSAYSPQTRLAAAEKLR
jgi:hypothetical protein